MSKRKQRAGIHVEASSPTLYRQFVAAVVPYVARRGQEGAFTILDEGRWASMLSAYETKELP